MTAYRFKERASEKEQNEAEQAFSDALSESVAEQPAHPALLDDKIGAPNHGATEVLDEE